jgi:hypothetical protein
MTKIIFSRKGFDSTYGKGASAIMPNGDLISFPIPVNNEKKKDKNRKDEKGIPYSEVFYQNKSYADWMLELKLPEYKLCHLDPDLIQSAYPRKQGWHGVFGQSGSAAGHLRNKDNRIRKGDIFLFFGSFKRTYLTNEKLVFERDHERHIIFGFLRVGEVYFDDFDVIRDIYDYHPHLQNSEETVSSYNNNAIFVATKKEDYGVFKYNENLVLTKEGFPKSFWELPSFFHDSKIPMTYHNVENYEKRNGKTFLQSASQGQEFVVKDKKGQDSKDIIEWAENLVASSGKIE